MSTPAIIRVPSQGKGESKRHVLSQRVILYQQRSYLQPPVPPLAVSHCREQGGLLTQRTRVTAHTWIAGGATHRRVRKGYRGNSRNRPADSPKYLTHVLFVFQKEVKVLANNTLLEKLGAVSSQYECLRTTLPGAGRVTGS